MLGFDRSDLTFARSLASIQLRDRYLGSAFGAIWAFVNPAMMLAIYTFVFGFVFQARVPGAESTLSYAIWMISGFGPWLGTVEALNAATNSVVAGTSLVKNVAFKTELLPIAAAVVGGVPLVVSLGFVMALLAFDGSPPSWHVLWILPILVVHAALVLALGMGLAAVNVFIRDLGIALPNLLIIILFATPIFYPIEQVPELARPLMRFNPFYVIAEGYRCALIDRTMPDLLGLAVVLVGALLLGVFSLKGFRRLKGLFESAL